MAMMAKMRSLAPAFILSVGVLFVLFMVISDSSVMQALGGRSNDVGSVNGEDISYKDFQSALDQQREILKQKGQDVDDESTDQFRDEVWDYIVSQTLVRQKVKELGIVVSNEEIREIILGDNPPAFLKQNFIDSLGNFNREQYENALFDPQNEKALIGAEESVREYRLNEKLQSFIDASINVNEDEVLRKFKDKNLYVNDAEFVLIPYSIFPDSTIEINDEDVRKYYDENIKKYKMNAQRKLKFVIFSNQPSKKDSEAVYKDLEYVESNFKSEDTASFKYYVDIYSSQPYSIDTLAVTSFNPDAIALLNSMKDGDIIGPLAAPEGVDIYHLIGRIKTDQEMFRASHILINNSNDDAQNKEEAMRIYKELIDGADFEKMAVEYSGDPGSAKRGGDLGWFGKGVMIKEFENAVVNGKIGEIQPPVKTSFGYHIIKVTGRTNYKFIVERLVNQIKQSAATRDERYNAAKDFSYLADKNDFDKEANLMNYKIQESGYFEENATSIPGIGINKRLVNFSFENSLNTVSDVYKVQQGFVVAIIDEVKEAGVKSFDEVKDQIKPDVIKEKKFEKAKLLADELRSKLGIDLEKINNIDPRFNVKNTGRFNSESNIPGIGQNYLFIKTAFQSEPNTITEPIKSNRGYYLIKVLSKTSFDSTAFSNQQSLIRNNLLQQKKRTLVAAWLNELKEKSDIVDNRYLFYGY